MRNGQAANRTVAVPAPAKRDNWLTARARVRKVAGPRAAPKRAVWPTLQESLHRERAIGLTLLDDADAEALPGVRLPPDLRWVTVDEVLDDVAELVVSYWPRTDPHGRLIFDNEWQSIVVTVASLQQAIATARTVRLDSPWTQLRAGTVLAARPVTDPADAIRMGVLDYGDVFGPTLDISLGAREFAQAQANVAATRRVLTAQQIVEIAREFFFEEGDEPPRDKQGRL